MRMSREAAALVLRLVSDSPEPVCAARLGTDDQRRSLQMSLASEPQDHDAIIRRGRATLYLSPLAADRLHGKCFHADLDGRSAFYLD